MKKSIITSFLFIFLLFSIGAVGHSMVDSGGLVITEVIFVKTENPLQFSVPDKYVSDFAFKEPITVSVYDQNKKIIHSLQSTNLTINVPFKEFPTVVLYVEIVVGDYKEVQKWNP